MSTGNPPEYTNPIKAFLLGTNIQVFNEAGLNKKILETVIGSSEAKLICANHNFHSLALMHKDREFKTYYDSSSTHWIDGMPLILMLKLKGHTIDRSWRLTFLDWQHSFFPMCSNNNIKVFILGATHENIIKAEHAISSKYPGLQITAHHGYLLESSKLNSEVVEKINTFSTDVLLIGMGMPKQEKWILENRDKVTAKVFLPLGGYFDYLAGATYTPPRWMGKLGIEWLARLVSSPKRLGYRYLIEPWPVIYRFFIELLGSSNNENSR